MKLVSLALAAIAFSCSQATCACDFTPTAQSVCIALGNSNSGLNNVSDGRFGQSLAVFGSGNHQLLAIGAPGATVDGLVGAGTVLVYRFNNQGVLQRIGRIEEGQFPFQATRAGANFGSLLGSGDIDGDGFDELLIYRPNNVGGTEPRLYVIQGVAEPRFTANDIFDRGDQFQQATQPNGIPVGEAQLTVSDFNADDFDDIALYEGSSSGSRVVAIELGSSAATNGGAFDLVIGGAADFRLANLSSGRIADGLARSFLLTGFDDSTDPRVFASLVPPAANQPTRTFRPGDFGLPASAAFGRGLASGDFSGDGTDDVVLGVPNTGSGSGRIVALEMGAIQDNSPQILTSTQFIASQPFAEFGRALHITDIDSDNITEIAVGAPGFGADTGQVTLLVPSRTQLTAVRTLNLGALDNASPTTGARFGEVLSSGFLNGDTRRDLVIAAPSRSIGTASATGQVFIVFGLQDAVFSNGFE